MLCWLSDWHNNGVRADADTDEQSVTVSESRAQWKRDIANYYRNNNSYSNSYSDSCSDGNGNSDRYSHCDSDFVGNTDRNSYSNSNSDRQSYSNENRISLENVSDNANCCGMKGTESVTISDEEIVIQHLILTENSAPDLRIQLDNSVTITTNSVLLLPHFEYLTAVLSWNRTTTVNSAATVAVTRNSVGNSGNSGNSNNRYSVTDTVTITNNIINTTYDTITNTITGTVTENSSDHTTDSSTITIRDTKCNSAEDSQKMTELDWRHTTAEVWEILLEYCRTGEIPHFVNSVGCKNNQKDNSNSDSNSDSNSESNSDSNSNSNHDSYCSRYCNSNSYDNSNDSDNNSNNAATTTEIVLSDDTIIELLTVSNELLSYTLTRTIMNYIITKKLINCTNVCNYFIISSNLVVPLLYQYTISIILTNYTVFKESFLTQYLCSEQLASLDILYDFVHRYSDQGVVIDYSITNIRELLGITYESILEKEENYSASIEKNNKELDEVNSLIESYTNSNSYGNSYNRNSNDDNNLFGNISYYFYSGNSYGNSYDSNSLLQLQERKKRYERVAKILIEQRALIDRQIQFYEKQKKAFELMTKEDY